MQYNRILITGGAGYIGSHVAKQLLEQNYEIVIVDNLSTGSIVTIQTLQQIKPFPFIKLDLESIDELKKLIRIYQINTIMHFAASIVVPESIVDPIKYYLNNTVKTTQLINLAVQENIQKFIFSSTAAVYGEPSTLLEKGIDEWCETHPINPYGMSKLMSETIIKDVAKAHRGFKYVIFRYFNVAGADMGNDRPRIGQSFPNATHLIKIAAECAVGKRDQMFIFGDDYDTKDGTCIRDYIHVDDLARAHIDAIAYLDENDSDTFNIGYGKGYSVKEVIQTMQKVSSCDIKAEMTTRRSGDPAMLIADNTKITKMMKWKPRYADVELICKSAYEWEKVMDKRNLL